MLLMRSHSPEEEATPQASSARALKRRLARGHHNLWKEHLLYPHQRAVRSPEIGEAVGDPAFSANPVPKIPARVGSLSNQGNAAASRQNGTAGQAVAQSRQELCVTPRGCRPVGRPA